ncbi:unnamed protein product [Callosobruchus maculatus]|uniref:Ubiquinol-cytochrome c chaperone domain-containing protein n=1 Tax=Callosobruchus maculatus TaxID=64391 RepID=A0A653DBF9_CALMS|nr:unnamed protein product [Callosobruchus maculatus]
MDENLFISSQSTNIIRQPIFLLVCLEATDIQILKGAYLNFSKFAVLLDNKLKATGYFIYEAIADNLDYVSFFEQYDLPDTFYSWFVVTELHIWMLSVRSMAQGDEGRFLRNCIIEALWNDVAQRAKKLGVFYQFDAPIH